VRVQAADSIHSCERTSLQMNPVEFSDTVGWQKPAPFPLVNFPVQESESTTLSACFRLLGCEQSVLQPWQLSSHSRHPCRKEFCTPKKVNQIHSQSPHPLGGTALNSGPWPCYLLSHSASMSVLLFCFLRTKSCYVAQAGLELVILLLSLLSTGITEVKYYTQLYIPVLVVPF
jgi:hypothetical protein